jgi:hypothetical protein
MPRLRANDNCATGEFSWPRRHAFHPKILAHPDAVAHRRPAGDADSNPSPKRDAKPDPERHANPKRDARPAERLRVCPIGKEWMGDQ